MLKTDFQFNNHDFNTAIDDDINTYVLSIKNDKIFIEAKEFSIKTKWRLFFIFVFVLLSISSYWYYFNYVKVNRKTK